jgi:hypothetical protein
MDKLVTLSTLADYQLLWNKLTPEEITNLVGTVVEGKTINDRFCGELRIGFRGSIIEGGVREAKLVYDAVGNTPTDYITLHEPVDGIQMPFPPQLCAMVLGFLLSNPQIQFALSQYFPGGIPALEEPVILPDPEPPAEPEPTPDPPVEPEPPVTPPGT